MDVERDGRSKDTADGHERIHGQNQEQNDLEMPCQSLIGPYGGEEMREKKERGVNRNSMGLYTFQTFDGNPQ
jgi:hypothetical protein